MFQPKKIVVFPAGGWQGRSVCKALAADKQYEVIGIVRNLDSAKLNLGGINVKELNVKLVQGDLNDPASYREYLKDAYGVFIVIWTIYAENGANTAEGKKIETQQSINLFKECKEVGIQHLVFSGLFGGAPDLPEEMYITSKMKLAEKLRETGIPYTLYYSSGYWENLQFYDMIKPQEDGSVQVNLMCPDNTYQMFTTTSLVGPYVKTIFDDRERFIGREVLNTCEWASWGSLAKRLGEMSGKKVTTPNYSDEVWQSDQMKQGMGEFWGIFDVLYRKSHKRYFAGTTGKEVYSAIPTFEDWARNNDYIKGIFGF